MSFRRSSDKDAMAVLMVSVSAFVNDDITNGREGGPVLPPFFLFDRPFLDLPMLMMLFLEDSTVFNKDNSCWVVVNPIFC